MPRPLFALPLLVALALGCATEVGAGAPLGEAALASPDLAMARARATKPERAFESGERSDYRVSVLGIPAAEGFLQVDAVGEGAWEFEAFGEALPWLAFFYDLRLSMKSLAGGPALKPKVLHREGINGGWDLKRDVTFQRRGRVRVRARKRGTKRTHSYRRRTTRDANDPLSVVFAMRAALLEANDPADLVGRRWHAFDGAWTRRLTVLDAAPDTETLHTEAGAFVVRRLRVRIHRVQVKGDRRIPKRKDDRTWDLWATADGHSVLVAAEGEGPFGYARAELIRYRAAAAVAWAPQVDR